MKENEPSLRHTSFNLLLDNFIYSINILQFIFGLFSFIGLIFLCKQKLTFFRRALDSRKDHPSVEPSKRIQRQSRLFQNEIYQTPNDAHSLIVPQESRTTKKSVPPFVNPFDSSAFSVIDIHEEMIQVANFLNESHQKEMAD